ncbi:Pinin [Brachionus plicatilis]|uniref:Pinin n=1 Tax=Brachionus plicatilis TaxID=10195 RepID=A0A3M7S059_BRAPC|nr:Pinin [Brachionus plicatilis]
MNDINSLQKQLEFHKKVLNDLNDSMKELNGENSSNDDTDFRKTKNNRLKKRKLNENLKRLNDDDDDDDVEDDLDAKKLSLQSSVVNQSVNVIKSKEELIKIQNKDSRSHQRNKRILGVILGTLKKFKCEESEQANTEKVQHRKEIEEKIEIKKIEEKRKMIEEKQKLEIEKSKNLKKIEIIETTIHLTECLNLWKERHSTLKKFIRTKSKPFIFYLPKIIDGLNQNSLDETTKNLEEELNSKKISLENELQLLDKEVKDSNKNNCLVTQVKIKQKDLKLNDFNDEDEFNEDKSNNLRLEDEMEEDNNVEMTVVLEKSKKSDKISCEEQ